MMRYPWRQRREGRCARSPSTTPRGEPVELDYVNPETGDACLPTMGFTAMMLRPGETRAAAAALDLAPCITSSRAPANRPSTARRFAWKRGDTFSAPVFALIEHGADKAPAFLIRVHDTPLQQKLDLLRRARAGLRN